jgi:hypothetical protein
MTLKRFTGTMERYGGEPRRASSFGSHLQEVGVDLPVQAATIDMRLAINLKPAKALGLDLPRLLTAAYGPLRWIAAPDYFRR